VKPYHIRCAINVYSTCIDLTISNGRRIKLHIFNFDFIQVARVFHLPGGEAAASRIRIIDIC